jgi:acetyl-CoA carboxylase biotin carboxyl carrier protein
MSKIMDDMGLTELDLERQFLFGVYRKHIHLSKIAAVPQFQGISQKAEGTSNTPAANHSNQDLPSAICTMPSNTLNSPMVGVAYLAPEPGAKPFTSVGAKVKAGDTVALIEAMKTFNPVKAESDGIVKEILIADGAAVEFDQPIMVIE